MNESFNLTKTAKEEGKKTHTGAMIAFILPASVKKKIVLKKKDYPDDHDIQDESKLHITLVYLGKANDLKDKKEQIVEVIKNFAEKENKVKGSISGVGRFNAKEDEPHPFYASFDSGQLPKFREHLVDALSVIGVDIATNHGFSPHITVLYMPSDAETPKIVYPSIDMEFECVTLSWAGENYNFKLGV